MSDRHGAYLQFAIERRQVCWAHLARDLQGLVDRGRAARRIRGVGAGRDAIDFATLIRCDAVTHHFGWDQRCIRLEITSRQVNQLMLVPLPAKGGTTRGDYLAPPGYYMLFVVRKPTGGVRVPSVGKFVRVM